MKFVQHDKHLLLSETWGRRCRPNLERGNRAAVKKGCFCEGGFRCFNNIVLVGILRPQDLSQETLLFLAPWLKHYFRLLC